jgi:Cu+-exporting ATPase
VAGPQVFENSRRIDAVVFDKTGTLTLGEMAVTSHTADVSHQALLKSIASKSSHPVAVAVAREFSQADEVELAGVLAVPGKGVRATWNGVIVEFGSRNFHPEIQLDSIGTTSWLFIDNKAVASVQVSDTLDPSSAHTVARLQAMGVEVHMASGDVASVADAVAKELNITHVHSQLTPDDKIAIIQNLQAEGKIVAMVGDGSNDAPALAQADIGIAMGRGTGIARATADITLLRPDLNLIPTSLRLSAATLRTIKQNLGWAFGYNIAAIPLAMTGNLNPMIAGIAMSASSVLVVTNSLRLRKRNFS